MPSLISNLAFALFWAGFALVSETPLCRIGCALLSAGNCYAIYALIRFRWLRPPDRRARLFQRRDFLLNPLNSTWLAQAPGVVLAALGGSSRPLTSAAWPSP